MAGYDPAVPPFGQNTERQLEGGAEALRPTVAAHSIGWTGGRDADALVGAGGGATVVGVYLWLSGIG